MKYMIPLSLLLFMTGCETPRNVTYSDSFYKNKIDVSVCTKNDMEVRAFNDKNLDNPNIEKYILYLETLKRPDRFQVPQGTKITIVKVYTKYIFGVGKIYFVLSKIDTPELKDVLVNSSRLFGRYYIPKKQLISEHAAYC